MPSNLENEGICTSGTGASIGTSSASDPVRQEGLEADNDVGEDEQSSERRRRRLAMNRITARERRRRKLQQIDDLKRGVQSLTIDNDTIREENRILREQIARMKSALQIPHTQAVHDAFLPASAPSVMNDRQLMFQQTRSHPNRQGIPNQSELQGQLSRQQALSEVSTQHASPIPAQQPMNGISNLQGLSGMSTLQAMQSPMAMNAAHQQRQISRLEFPQQEQMPQAPLAPFIQDLASTQLQYSTSAILQNMLTNIYAQQATHVSQQHQQQQPSRKIDDDPE